MFWLTRAFFLIIAAVAITGLVSGVGCTRRGKSSPIPATASPLTTINVNPATGSDSTGNGTATKPYKTLTKAVAVVKASLTPNLTIQLATGAYDAANGEIFPIVIPTGMTIAGSGFGRGPFKNMGSFIDGFGEDTAYEKLLGKPPGSAFATLEVAQAVTSGVSLTGVYVGSSRLALRAGAAYAGADVLGALTASHAAFASGTPLTHPNLGGIVLPGGSLSCTACTILGGDYALLAFTAPTGVAPNISLTGQPTESIIGGKIGINTDGSANVDASYQTFQSQRYGYQDSVAPIVSPLPIAVIDFGQGPTQSSGGNIFIGAASVVSEISVTAAQATVYAFGDVWNRLTQGTDSHGLYAKPRVFLPGARGRNVTIAGGATGSSVLVGPISATPTPQPSPTPSGGPTPTSSPT
ncbi:MAG: DUF1565 domain-containing protein [Candidatus Tumulicola sp.]